MRTYIGGVKIFFGTNTKDKRGNIWTSWKKNKKNKKNKIIFNHDKFSISKKNVLRGLHYDSKTWKLVSCPFGKLFLVIVNYNKNSKYYKKYFSIYLSDKKNISVLIPPNFANGHLCISDLCLFHYKLSYNGSYNDVKNQKNIKWNDKKLNIKWPITKNLILSKRDK